MLVTTMYFLFHVCDFKVWHIYSLWSNSKMASSLYGVLSCPPVWGFEESTQEPTLRFNIQPATHSSRFSDVQSNEANSSNQPTVALSDFPTVSSRLPTPPASATQRASTGRAVKAASLSPLFSIKTRYK